MFNRETKRQLDNLRKDFRDLYDKVNQLEKEVWMLQNRKDPYYHSVDCSDEGKDDSLQILLEELQELKTLIKEPKKKG